MASFIESGKNNPYYEIVNRFLEGQVTMLGYSSLVTNNGITINKSTSLHTLALQDTSLVENHELILPNSAFAFTDETRSDHTGSLINHILLSFLVQSFEGFESFLKDIFREYINTKVASPPISKIILEKMPRNIKDVIQHLSSFSPALSKLFSKSIKDKIHVIETVRHSVVHDNGIINLDSKNAINNDFFNRIFELIATDNNQFEIFVKEGRFRPDKELNDFLSNLALNVFTYLSREEGYPLNLKRLES